MNDAEMNESLDTIAYEFGLDKIGLFEMQFIQERNDYIDRVRSSNKASFQKAQRQSQVQKMKSFTTAKVVGLNGKEENKMISDLECHRNPMLFRCMRFSKVKFPPDFTVPDASIFPLDTNDFPIQPFLSDILLESLCPSVIDVTDALHNINIDALARQVGGAPSMPSCDPENPFWEDMEEIIDVQIIRRADESMLACKLMDLPKLWTNYTLKDAAEAVHDEYPGLHQSKFVDSLLHAKSIAPDPNIIPQRSKRTYLRGPVMLADLNTWSVSTVGHHSFQSKWHFGRPRPEEVMWRMLNMMQDPKERMCIPRHIVRKAVNLKLSAKKSSPTDFTAYPEGSPDHPSWPAMHSAASSLSLWLAVVCNLTKEQIEEAKKTDYAVAYARTIAGVHYPSDNIDGLNIGQEVIAKVLPLYLNSMYGSDIAKVEAKIELLRFDWNDYEPEVDQCQ